jgi:hypothetical protein
MGKWSPFLAVLVLRFIKMFAGGKVGVLFEMFRTEWGRDRMFFPEPFAEINELASFGAEGSKRAGQPIACTIAGGATNLSLFCRTHINAVHQVSVMLKTRGLATRGAPRISGRTMLEEIKAETYGNQVIQRQATSLTIVTMSPMSPGFTR